MGILLIEKHDKLSRDAMYPRPSCQALHLYKIIRHTMILDAADAATTAATTGTTGTTGTSTTAYIGDTTDTTDDATDDATPSCVAISNI